MKPLRIDGERLADELVPMGLATRMINLRVYRRDGSATRLTGIAHAFAALAPVYTHNLDGSEIRQLTRQELNSGFFRQDGAEFQFLDGRPRIVNIAVTTRAIDLVTETLSDPNSAERQLRSLPQVSES